MASSNGRARDAPALSVADEQNRETAAPVAATLTLVALGLQRTVGNRATGYALGQAVLARETKTKPKAKPKPEEKTLASALAKKDIAAITAMASFWRASDEERIQALTLLLDRKSLSKAEKVAVSRLWDDMGDGLSKMIWRHSTLWWKSFDKGAPVERWMPTDRFDLWLVTGPTVITEHQAKRVPAMLEKLSRWEYEQLRLNLWFAKSRKERAYIAKAIAAGRSLAHVDKFADIIRGKGDDWLRKYLNVVEEDPSARTGPGIRQQWQMSCGPTSVQVLHGQTDPIYALNLNGKGDLTTLGSNPRAKKEQGDILQHYGSTPTAIGTAGTGAWVEDHINALKAETGLTYKWTPVTAVLPTNPADGAVAKALTKIKGWLAEGIYIPIVIGGTPGQTAHYNVILRYDSKWGYLIHDPGQGYSGWVTTRMILDNTMSPPLAWRLLAGYDTPTKTGTKK